VQAVLPPKLIARGSPEKKVPVFSVYAMLADPVAGWKHARLEDHREEGAKGWQEGLSWEAGASKEV